ncbi:sigma-54-dependent transcriptional regulator [Bowmanella denitrificans]|uniref:sigma-54-dependent transcriptional regulator n=1 Tax=Bowmanella denitrificans TaxID=366582 RepID=UPI000C9B1C09|nr:sigma-54 dependent transcriptional regulator [Bowmanella denitrificans]
MSEHLLIADDDPGVLSALGLLMKAEGYQTIMASSPKEVLTILAQRDVQLLLMDLNYSRDTTSGEEGLELLQRIRQQDDCLPIVVMSGWGSIDVAVASMRLGANDFIQKPWENDRLMAIVQNQLKLAGIQRHSQKLSGHNQLLQAELSGDTQMVAESDSSKELMALIQQVAFTDASILLTGENGTGKSLYARYIHDLSHRNQTPLVSVNMGAVTESLFESEMFGHVKGAFTDAKAARIGRFELADQGTLFLDEIANTPYSQQGKLLRVLEDSQFEKVGSSKTQQVNIRLICATNADLGEAVRLGTFRKDLLYRLNTVEIQIPPLRQRKEDILPLAMAFLDKVARKYNQPRLSIDSAAQHTLQTYAWPGNVRELQHMMERAHILCRSGKIGPQDLGLNNTAGTADNAIAGNNEADLRSLEIIEAELIRQRLAYFDGNAIRAAESLGLSRSAFYRRLEK